MHGDIVWIGFQASIHLPTYRHNCCLRCPGLPVFPCGAGKGGPGPVGSCLKHELVTKRSLSRPLRETPYFSPLTRKGSPDTWIRQRHLHWRGLAWGEICLLPVVPSNGVALHLLGREWKGSAAGCLGTPSRHHYNTGVLRFLQIWPSKNRVFH